MTPWGQDPRSGAWFWEAIWKLAEMDADHVTAWSMGGATDRANCEMLCKSHKRAKGNR
nr:HNH endonuclease [Fibrobacter sp. UWT2]